MAPARPNPLCLVLLLMLISCGVVSSQGSAAQQKKHGIYKTGVELMTALADPNGPDILELANDVRFVETDFPSDGSPVVISRNVTFTGRPDHWMSFSMGRLRRKLLLLNNTVLAVQYIIMSEHWDDAKSGMESEIMCPVASDVQAIVFTNFSAIFNYMCMPPALVRASISIDVRPSWIPGDNVLYDTVPYHKMENAIEIPYRGLPLEVLRNTTMLGAPSPPPPSFQCTHDPDAPYLERCYDNVAYFKDYASIARTFSDLRRIETLNYALHFTDSYILCAHMVDESCFAKYEYTGCLAIAQANQLAIDKQYREQKQKAQSAIPPPSQSTTTPATDPTSNPPSGGSSTGMIVGVVVGVAVGCFLIIAAVAVVVRRRQRIRVKYLPNANNGPTMAKTFGDGESHSPNTSSAEDASRDIEEGAAALQKAQPEVEEKRAQVAADSASPGGLDREAEAPKEDAVTAAATAAADRKEAGRPVGNPAVAALTAEAANLRQESLTKPGDLQPQPDVVVSPLTPLRSNLELKPDVAQVVKLLPVVRGKGAFGKVYEGLYGGEKVAVKVMLRDMFDLMPTAGAEGEAAVVAAVKAGNPHLQSFAQEVEVLGRCQHPNVVRLLAACLTPPRYCLVMELMDTSLQNMVFGSGCGELLPLPKVLHIATEVTRSLEYLHPTIVHRDLKPDNILVNHSDSPRPVVKVSDFGLARLRSTVVATRSPGAGTPSYMAPECFDATVNKITHRVDVYSWGVVLWALLTGVQPWAGLAMVEIAYRVTLVGERLPAVNAVVPGRCPRQLQRLLEQCWSREPERRPAAAEIVKQMILIAQQPNDPADEGDMGINSGSNSASDVATPYNCAATRAARYNEAAAAAHATAVATAAAATAINPPPAGPETSTNAAVGKAVTVAVPPPPSGENLPEGQSWKTLPDSDQGAALGALANAEPRRPGMVAVGPGGAFPAAALNASNNEDRQPRGHVYKLVHGENGTELVSISTATPGTVYELDSVAMPGMPAAASAVGATVAPVGSKSDDVESNAGDPSIGPAGTVAPADAASLEPCTPHTPKDSVEVSAGGRPDSSPSV